MKSSNINDKEAWNFFRRVIPYDVVWFVFDGNFVSFLIMLQNESFNIKEEKEEFLWARHITFTCTFKNLRGPLKNVTLQHVI